MKRFITRIAVVLAAITAVLMMTEGTAEARSYVTGYFEFNSSPTRGGSLLTIEVDVGGTQARADVESLPPLITL